MRVLRTLILASLVVISLGVRGAEEVPTSPQSPAAQRDSPELFTLHELAAQRGWKAVTEDELAEAISRSPSHLGSVRSALGETAILVTGGVVYRVPKSEAVAIPEGVTGAPGSGGDAPEGDLWDWGPIRPPTVSEARNANGAVPRALLGNDDRVPILPRTVLLPAPPPWFRVPAQRLFVPPFRQLTRIVLSNPPANLAQSCSGAFFGPRHVLTSGHCFNAFGDLFPVTTATVQAGASAATSLMSATSGSFFVVGNDPEDDLALIVLPDTPAVTKVGFYGWQVLGSGEVGNWVVLRGYPGAGQFCWTQQLHPAYPFCGDAPPPFANRILFGVSCPIESLDGGVLVHECDSTGGMSGGPLSKVGGGDTPRIAAVLKGDYWVPFETNNRASALTSFKAALLCSFALSTPSASVPFDCGL